MLKNYQFTQNFKSPVLTPTGNGRMPHKVQYKLFKKGEIHAGRVHKVNGVDTCVMIKDQYVVPFDVIRALTVESTSKASGDSITMSGITTGANIKKASQDYARSIMVGGILGLLSTILAEQKNWIPALPNNKKWGIVLGAALLGYVTYEHNKYLQKITLPKLA